MGTRLLTRHATSTLAEGLRPGLALLGPATIDRLADSVRRYTRRVIATAHVCPLGTRASTWHATSTLGRPGYARTHIQLFLF